MTTSTHERVEAGARAASASRLRRLAPWLVTPLCLAAVALAAGLVLGAGEALAGRVLGLALGLSIALALGWVMVSVFYPARAERTCPRCGGEGLERLERESTRGLRCRLCAHVDRSASSFLIAESEGSLEPLVLRERALRRGARADGGEVGQAGGSPR